MGLTSNKNTEAVAKGMENNARVMAFRDKLRRKQKRG